MFTLSSLLLQIDPLPLSCTLHEPHPMREPFPRGSPHLHMLREECAFCRVCFNRSGQGRTFSTHKISQCICIFPFSDSICISSFRGTWHNFSRTCKASMATLHAPNLYTHGPANYSTPSFSSTAYSSRQDVNSLKHVFSSPLAERYAQGELLGAPTTFDDGHGQERTISGKFRHRHPSSWFSSISRKSITSPSIRKLRSNSKEHQPESPRYKSPTSSVRVAPWEREISNPLLSPISFTCPAAVSDASGAVDPYARGKRPSKLYQKTAHSVLVSPLEATDGNRCVFPLCEFDPQSAQGDVSVNHAASKDIRSQGPTKSRALSLGNRLRPSSPCALPIDGDPDGVQLRKALHRTTASRELRRSAGSMPAGKDCGLWVDQIVRATRCAGSYQQHHDADSRGITRNGKPRLWLDATKNEERIQEAVSFQGWFQELVKC